MATYTNYAHIEEERPIPDYNCLYLTMPYITHNVHTHNVHIWTVFQAKVRDAFFQAERYSSGATQQPTFAGFVLDAALRYCFEPELRSV